MKQQLNLISVFILLNLAIGRLFQESNGVVCFLELGIIAFTGFCYWHFSSPVIERWAVAWNPTKGKKQVLVQGGLGLGATLTGIFISQIMVIAFMTVVFNCVTPSFNVMQASLTNNIAVNLLCYFSLLFLFVHRHSQKTAPVNSFRAPVTTPDKIKVSRNGSTHFIEPATDIYYVSTANNCIVLHTSKGLFVKYQSLKSFQKTLPPETFKRVHRSYLVNIHFVETQRKNRNGDGWLTLRNGDTVKFSRTYDAKWHA